MTELVQRIGQTDETRNGRRAYVVVRASIETTTGTHETTEHETVTDPVRLSITGELFAPYDRRDNPSACGQIAHYLADVTTPAPGWTLDEVRELADIWERWHLSDMRAGCAHQTVIWEESTYGRRPSLTLTEPCPNTGYRYGHAWLTEPVPAEVLDRVRYLMRDRSHEAYTARGYDGAGKAYPARG